MFSPSVEIKWFNVAFYSCIKVIESFNIEHALSRQCYVYMKHLHISLLPIKLALTVTSPGITVTWYVYRPAGGRWLVKLQDPLTYVPTKGTTVIGVFAITTDSLSDWNQRKNHIKIDISYTCFWKGFFTLVLCTCLLHFPPQSCQNIQI